MSQPTPFEVKGGFLYDITRRPVDFNTIGNLEEIATAFKTAEDLKEKVDEMVEKENEIEELEREISELKEKIKELGANDQNIRNEMRDIKDWARDIFKAADCVIEDYTN